MNVFIDQDLNVHALLGNLNSPGVHIMQEEASVNVSSDASAGTDGSTGTDMSGSAAGMTVDANGNLVSIPAKDSFLTSYPFVIGISSATLVFSIILGILLAKRKIKKGYELYED